MFAVSEKDIDQEWALSTLHVFDIVFCVCVCVRARACVCVALLKLALQIGQVCFRKRIDLIGFTHLFRILASSKKVCCSPQESFMADKPFM